ncbi:MAG TPA: hypothetical protein EYN91_05745 [Candidatus Melainabacteria bacterium]|jgi:uncharacterized membrane protein|nr:hypothetical protein [Candidatus Melainabacteria bacterium]HIN65593.1 hypothetical protein [Candidatus Obscuribacterales bacterium]
MSQYLKETRRYHLVILFALLSIALWVTPVQHMISIGRFQHYAMAIFLFSCGYFIQTAFSWKELPKLARFSYIATGMFFFSVALVFYQNPWLVDRASVASDEKMQTRTGMMLTYMGTSVALGIVWLKVAYDEAMEKRRKLKQESQTQSQEATQG